MGHSGFAPSSQDDTPLLVINQLVGNLGARPRCVITKDRRIFLDADIAKLPDDLGYLLGKRIFNKAYDIHRAFHQEVGTREARSAT